MTNLLRKFWESVYQRSAAGPCSNQNPNTQPDQLQLLKYLQISSTGDFDRIPVDVFLRIIKYLGPKESAKLSTVCKSWKFIIADDRLWNQQDPWDSVFFAETQLRFGFPLQYDCRTFRTQVSELSFMQAYAERAKVPDAIVIDGGSGYCKYGWSKYALPFGRSATMSEFGNIESPMYSRLRHYFSAIYTRLQVKPSTQPIVLSIPICHCDDTETDRAARRQLKDAIYTALFDMNVPAVCAVNQAVLAMFAARRTSGIVVNIGFHQTSIVPVLNGRVMHSVGVEILGMGALKLTGFLTEKIQQQNMILDSPFTVLTLKENLCYVALDYKAELRKDTEASYKVAEGLITLSKERFQTGEILFRPRMAGVLTMSLHQGVALCMKHCQEAELTADNSWFKHIVLAGGSACLPGLAERLQKEVNEILPQSISTGVKVVPPPYGIDSAWFGAKLISNLSTFPGAWCVTRKQHRPRTRRNTSL